MDSIKELQSLKVESFSMNVLVRKKSICFYNHPSKIFVTFLRTGYLLSTDRKFILTCKSLKEIEKMEPDTIGKKKLLNIDVFSL